MWPESILQLFDKTIRQLCQQRRQRQSPVFTDSSRTVSHLVRHHSGLYVVSNSAVWFHQFLTVPVQSSFLIQRLFNIVEPTQCRTLPPPFSRVQQCRTPSTNCTNFRQHSSKAVCPSPCLDNNVELHRRTSRRHVTAVSRVQQCRTPSTNCMNFHQHPTK